MRRDAMGSVMALAVALAAAALCAQGARAGQAGEGRGTFANPPLHADFPDPDVIRVGGDFYFATTTFVNAPGLTILHSRDLVNWEYASHVIPRLEGREQYDMVNGTAYRGGVFAPSLRHHRGTFYVAVTPTGLRTRIYRSRSVAGPWTRRELDVGAFDPGLFIEDDGKGYIFTSGGWDGHVTVHTLNADYSKVTATRKNVLFHPNIEGCKVIKHAGYYYVLNSRPVWEFSLMCSRSRSIFGPYETITNLTETKGGHQGAVVDLPDGGWYGFVMKDCGAVGRMTYVSPVFWKDGWPVWGTPEAPGRVPAVARKPIQEMPVARPATSDDFSSRTLGLQWQWNHNPDDSRWSLTERPGWLRLRPTKAEGFWTARNTLTQKGWGPRSRGVVKADLGRLRPGDVFSFGTLGVKSGCIKATADGPGSILLTGELVVDDGKTQTVEVRSPPRPLAGTTVYLRTDLDFERNRASCSWSPDGQSWTPSGDEFALEWGWHTKGTFQGVQFAISCYNPDPAGSGHVDVDSFTLETAADMNGLSRGRPRKTAKGRTFVADNGNLIRGPFASTEWGPPPPREHILSVKDKGCNALHLYAECYDIKYPAAGSTAPGYAAERVDRMVEITREAGLYLVMTIGNGANNGKFNREYVMGFWRFYAPRYRNETHVIYEIQNEPVAWSPPYPKEALDMELEAYRLIRSLAPDTLVLPFSYAVLGKGEDALKDLATVGGSIDWGNAAIAFHGYAGHVATAKSVEEILAAGYPCFMTEFCATDWGTSHHVLDAELAAELERLGISWLSFQTVATNSIGTDFKKPDAFFEVVNNTGLSWPADFGTWPPARGVYGNDGRPRATTGAWKDERLVGTLRIEAEDFDIGGQAVAYHDKDRANRGGKYRADESVDIERAADDGGGYAVVRTAAGEWLEYAIFVTEPGRYGLGLRVAATAGCSVQVLVGGKDKTGTWSLPGTGGRRNWRTATRDVFLEYGRHTMRVVVTGGAPSLNWIELTPAAEGCLPDGVYKLLNRASGLAMEGVTDGGKVVQKPCTGAEGQQWRMKHLGADNYKVTSVSNNWSWNVHYTSNGSPLKFVHWWGIEGQHQRYIVRSAGNGYWRARPVKGGLSLTVAGSSPDAASPVEQYEFRGDSHQQWGILPPSAPSIPAGLLATAPTRSRVRLTWTPVKGATRYHVKRSTDRDGPYAKAARVTPPEFTGPARAPGERCYYVVSAEVGGVESLDSAAVRAPAMMLHLAFDERGGTTAADSSGNRRTGRLVNGARLEKGRKGNAVRLDGVDDHVVLPEGVVSGLFDFTVAAWVNLSKASVWSRIFDFGTGTDNYMFLTPAHHGGRVLQFAIRTPSIGEQKIRDSKPMPVGEWVHVAVTFSGSVGTLYVNGAPVGTNGSVGVTPAMLGATTRNYIGRSQFPPDAYLAGLVDDFRIYDAALTVRHVAELAGVKPDSR